jgi:hypothetical protein
MLRHTISSRRGDMTVSRRVLMAILTIAFLVAALAAEAQLAGRVPRVGFLSLADGLPPRIEAALLEGLREDGWVEGKSITIERRYADTPVAGPTGFPSWRRNLWA